MPRSASGVRRPLGLFIVLPVEHKHLSDLLDRVGAGFLADGRNGEIALVALEGPRAHLDQLVHLERPVDLLDHFPGKAFRADVHHRLELVRPGFQRPALRRAQHGNEPENLMSKYRSCYPKIFTLSYRAGGRAALASPPRPSSKAGARSGAGRTPSLPRPRAPARRLPRSSLPSTGCSARGSSASCPTRCGLSMYRRSRRSRPTSTRTWPS